MISKHTITALATAALLTAGTGLVQAQSSGGSSGGGASSGSGGGASGLSGGGASGGATGAPRAATSSQPSVVNPSARATPGALSNPSTNSSTVPGAGSNVQSGPGSTVGQQVPVYGTQNSSIGSTIDQSSRNSSGTQCGGDGTSSSGATSANCGAGDPLGTPSIISGSEGSSGAGAVDVTGR
ncbi:hypothetical protein [Terrihabitans sp. B22-R8]|uniref:hypothetical protein n=1 Tax=Terrihabitans sp. B22-R8 TaxID=3425128 RepID=UPI00403CA835